jgi:hypothetical protein
MEETMAPMPEGEGAAEVVEASVKQPQVVLNGGVNILM